MELSFIDFIQLLGTQVRQAAFIKQVLQWVRPIITRQQATTVR